MKILLIISVLLLQSCTSVHVAVESIASAHFTPSNYIVVSGMKDVDSSDLRFKELVQFVESSLDQIGYERANSAESAEILVYLSYGMGESKNNTTHVPNLVTGKTQSYSSNYHARNVVLSAYNRSNKMLWSTTMSSEGKKRLVEVFPHMILAGTPYFGKTVNGVIREEVSFNDSRTKRKTASAK